MLLETDPQKDVNSKLLKFTISIGILIYTFWSFIPDPIGTKIFFIGNAIFIFLLSLYIKQISKPSFITFFLFCITLNNLLDEVCFNPLKLGWNEFVTTAIIIIIYFLRDKELPNQ